PYTWPRSTFIEGNRNVGGRAGTKRRERAFPGRTVAGRSGPEPDLARAGTPQARAAYHAAAGAPRRDTGPGGQLARVARYRVGRRGRGTGLGLPGDFPVAQVARRHRPGAYLHRHRAPQGLSARRPGTTHR